MPCLSLNYLWFKKTPVQYTEEEEEEEEHNSDIKQDILVEFRQILCSMSGKHYLASVNTFCLIHVLSDKI